MACEKVMWESPGPFSHSTSAAFKKKEKDEKKEAAISSPSPPLFSNRTTDAFGIRSHTVDASHINKTMALQGDAASSALRRLHLH